MNPDYPEADFPWNFYFNGELMPKWGACWFMANLSSFLDLERGFDNEVGHRDIYIVECKIDHVGVAESADPDVFIYVVQEVLHLLLSKRDTIVASLGEEPPDVYSGLLDAAFRMREIAEKQRCAYWTSGYEADRLRLIETMSRSQLPPSSPEFLPPPHIHRFQFELNFHRERQARQLHQLAQSGQFDKSIRKRLNEIRSTR